MASKPKRASGPNRWRKQIHHDMNWAQQALIAQDELLPTWVIRAADGQDYIVATPFDAPSDDAAEQVKDMAATTIKLMCIAYDAMSLTQIVEAWALDAAKADMEGEKYVGLRPAKSERRIEVVMVTIHYREGDKIKIISESREIERRANGKVSGLKPMGGVWNDDNTDTKLRGRFTHLLPPIRPPTHDREMAKRLLSAMGNIEEMGRM